MVLASRNASSPLVGWPGSVAGEVLVVAQTTDVPSGRMKLTLLGSMPSAIQATLTPAPVMPSDRAVGWGDRRSPCWW